MRFICERERERRVDTGEQIDRGNKNIFKKIK